MYGMYHFYGGMGWSWIIGLLILGVVIWLVIKVINQNNTTVNTGKSALDILKERYARGEISREEFEEKKQVIRG
ncbi:MAG TPA: SHOCT domain-containing protein [Bacteroidales bacterium]|nr:SHOCT domain-containing protein [Bacteroidales bacterium]